MSKALAILALLCVAGCYATEYYVSVYTSSTASQDTFLYKDNFDDSACSAFTTYTDNKGLVGTGTNSGKKITYSNAAGTCGTGTIDDITLDTAKSSGDYYYVLSATAATYTAQTFYIGTYSATGCSEDDFVAQQSVTLADGCVDQTIGTDGKQGSLALAFPDITLSADCDDDDTCATNCAVDAETVVIDSDSTDNCISDGDSTWYKVTTTSQDPDEDSSDAASALSFATLALCALFALLF
jgi:hypothetical protein